MAKEKKILKFKWQIKEVDVKDLIPYEFNNKIHNEKKVNLLANIMDKFWYIDEIVIDKNNIVIAWHGRLESIKKMGYEAVEVKVLDIDSKDASQLRLLHNKISEYETENDLENMKIEVDMLWYDKTMDGLDVSLKDLYPEFDAPPFDPDEYKEDEKKEWQVAVIVFFKNFGDAELCKQDLEWLWYAPIVKG